jgi:hypothetical protein
MAIVKTGSSKYRPVLIECLKNYSGRAISGSDLIA